MLVYLAPILLYEKNVVLSVNGHMPKVELLEFKFLVFIFLDLVAHFLATRRY